MDFKQIKEYAIAIRRELLAKGITPSAIILFGSYAKKCAREDSDIDIAVVSRDFGKNRFEEGVMLNLLVSKIDHRIEAIPISLTSFMDTPSVSPIIYEIQKTGVCLL